MNAIVARILLNSCNHKYNENLENLICNKFSGDFQRVLRSLVNANRNESNAVDSDLSVKEAKVLSQSGVKMIGTDEDEFLRILCSHSFIQLKDIFKHYDRLTGHSMETAIAKEFSGDLFAIFNAIVLSANSFAHYYAIRLHSCIHGIGTDDESMTRILISRSEIDLEDIKDIYKRKYSRKLTDDIANDTSGDYKKITVQRGALNEWSHQSVAIYRMTRYMANVNKMISITAENM
ncbi:unnamed protein product [Oppiella nova]|uniref:Annexin n=1 Tax=Oppiella nova TaxID=334625 RepID=A0A7R9M3X8_9ACAR|nr:unnamed protein product [Oppiella nova]CAG2170105.1 unnamed protein product [Oppiella nova]